MIVKAKIIEKITFKEICIGTVFRYDNDVYMKVRIEDDYLACPRCDEDINIMDEIESMAVDLETGEVYQFDYYTPVEIVKGTFVEE